MEASGGNRRLLVRAGHVLTQGTAGDIRDGAVLISGSVIERVGTAAALIRDHPDVPVRGTPRDVVTPGFVNAHYHFSEALTTGVGERFTLTEWLARVIGPIEGAQTTEIAAAGTALRAGEMAASGVTTVSDMFVHDQPGSLITLGVADGVERVGLRAVLSFGSADIDRAGTVVTGRSAAIELEHRALADRCARGSRLSARLGITSVMAMTDEQLARTAALARGLGIGVHLHAAEVREEVSACRIVHGKTPVARAIDSGLADVSLALAHAVWVNPADTARIAATGVGVVHNPVANMILASGVAPIGRYQAAGIPVAIGTDGPSSNDSSNMLEAVKMAALLQRVHSQDAEALLARAVMRMATLGGAEVLGLDSIIGSLEPGKQADLVIFDGDGYALAAPTDPYQQLVMASSPADVAAVFVGGVLISERGRPTRVPLPELVSEAREAQGELLARIAASTGRSFAF